MTVVERIVDNHVTQFINFCIAEILLFSQFQHLLSVGSSQEFSFAIQQLQRIPLTRIVRSRNDDTTIGTAHAYCQLRGRCGGITNVNDVEAHTHQGTTNYVAHHWARDTSIATYDNFSCLAGNEHRIGCCKLDDIQRIEGIASASANSTADA